MIEVRPFAAEHDAQPLALLLREMADEYGASVAPDRQVADELARHARWLDILVALRDGGAPVGFATFAPLFPVAGLVPFLCVQQIYVARAVRREGVARRLMATVAGVALARGLDRVEWSTAASNAAARALYDGLGAAGSEKIHYTLSGEALTALAADPKPLLDPAASPDRSC